MTIGRFQVMAVLQAARAHHLGLPIPSAKSWGINRAIFYAVMKRRSGGKGSKYIVGKKRYDTQQIVEDADGKKKFYIGNEFAFIHQQEPFLMFAFGGKANRPEDYDHEVKDRFTRYDRAWEDALAIVRVYDPEVLKNQYKFYTRVYLPRRDRLIKIWK